MSALLLFLRAVDGVLAGLARVQPRTARKAAAAEGFHPQSAEFYAAVANVTAA
jgi:hypothetical protein